MIKPGLWDVEPVTRFFRVRMRSGEVHVGCDPARVGGAWVPKMDPELLRWMGEEGHTCLEEVPIEKDEMSGECARCGGVGVEAHHTAPQGVFEDADDWPIIDLCTEHHREWHERMNAWADGKRPLGWEGVGIVE